MKTKILTTVFLAAMTACAYAGPADDAINARQACMKANGGSMATYVPIMKGEAAFDAAKVKAAADAVMAACGTWAASFADTTMKGETVQTWAKPEIWSDKAGWEAANKAYMDAMTAVTAATDDATFKAAFPGLGASCGGCHDKYRTPKG